MAAETEYDIVVVLPSTVQPWKAGVLGTGGGDGCWAKLLIPSKNNTTAVLELLRPRGREVSAGRTQSQHALPGNGDAEESTLSGGAAHDLIAPKPGLCTHYGVRASGIWKDRCPATRRLPSLSRIVT